MINFTDWGLIDYQKAWNEQLRIFKAVIEAKKNNQAVEKIEKIFFCEHPNVYTIGKSGNENNLLIKSDFLKKIDATCIKIDRGGDITYHGKGQIVGYPVIDLEYHKLGVKKYVFLLEEAIINTLAKFEIKGERLENATGVWIAPYDKDARKICAIGIKASHFVTMHGFALNVNTDLNYFNYINPCGFIDKGVTSMQKEIEDIVDIVKVKSYLKKELMNLFKVEN